MTAKRSNGVQATPDKTPVLFALMPNPAAQSFLVSQKLALESARFWARRMHAIVDQMETLAACASPDDVAKAQSRFLDQMREDYTAESKAIGALLAIPTHDAGERPES